MDIGGLSTDYNSIINNNKQTSFYNKVSDVDLESASDEELMDVCKKFESYLVEQVIDSMEKMTLKDEDEEGEYMKQFGSMLTTEYADIISNNGGLGLANHLYESMKTNCNSNIMVEE